MKVMGKGKDTNFTLYFGTGKVTGKGKDTNFTLFFGNDVFMGCKFLLRL